MKIRKQKTLEFKTRLREYIKKVTPEGFIKIAKEKYKIPFEPLETNMDKNKF